MLTSAQQKPSRSTRAGQPDGVTNLTGSSKLGGRYCLTIISGQTAILRPLTLMRLACVPNTMALDILFIGLSYTPLSTRCLLIMRRAVSFPSHLPSSPLKHHVGSLRPTPRRLRTHLSVRVATWALLDPSTSRTSTRSSCERLKYASKPPFRVPSPLMALTSGPSSPIFLAQPTRRSHPLALDQSWLRTEYLYRQFGNVLVLAATYRAGLTQLVSQTTLEKLLTRTIDNLSRLQPISPSLSKDAEILQSVRKFLFGASDSFSSADN